jgi:hypothetical protein
MGIDSHAKTPSPQAPKELTPGCELPPNLYWNGNIIYYKVHYAGRKAQGSTGTRVLKEAEKKRDDALFELRKGDAAAEKKNVRIGELLDDYIEYLRLPGKPEGGYGDRSWKSAQYTINSHVRPFFGSIRADKLTSDDLTNYWNHGVEEYKKARAKEGDWVVSVSKELTWRRILQLALQRPASMGGFCFAAVEIDLTRLLSESRLRWVVEPFSFRA